MYTSDNIQKRTWGARVSSHSGFTSSALNIQVEACDLIFAGEQLSYVGDNIC